MEQLSNALGILFKHLDIISMIIDLIENKKVDRERMIQLINEAQTQASDAEMHREFPT